MTGKVKILTLLAVPSLIFATPYIKTAEKNNEFITRNVVAVIKGVKEKIAIVKTNSGYSIVVIEKLKRN